MRQYFAPFVRVVHKSDRDSGLRWLVVLMALFWDHRVRSPNNYMITGKSYPVYHCITKYYPGCLREVLQRLVINMHFPADRWVTYQGASPSANHSSLVWLAHNTKWLSTLSLLLCSRPDLPKNTHTQKKKASHTNFYLSGRITDSGICAEKSFSHKSAALCLIGDLVRPVFLMIITVSSDIHQRRLSWGSIQSSGTDLILALRGMLDMHRYVYQPRREQTAELMI